MGDRRLINRTIPPSGGINWVKPQSSMSIIVVLIIITWWCPWCLSVCRCWSVWRPTCRLELTPTSRPSHTRFFFFFSPVLWVNLMFKYICVTKNLEKSCLQIPWTSKTVQLLVVLWAICDSSFIYVQTGIYKFEMCFIGTISEDTIDFPSSCKNSASAWDGDQTVLFSVTHISRLTLYISIDICEKVPNSQDTTYTGTFILWVSGLLLSDIWADALLPLLSAQLLSGMYCI